MSKDKNNNGSGTILDFSNGKAANDGGGKQAEFKMPEPLRPRYEVVREREDSGEFITEVFEGHVAMDRTWFAVMRSEDGLLIHAFPAHTIASCTLLDA